MTKLIPIILLALFIALIGQADAGTYRDFVNHCIYQKNGDFPYTVEQVDPYMLELYTPASKFSRTMQRGMAFLIRGASSAITESQNAWSILANGEYSKGKRIQNNTKQMLKWEAKTHRLNQYEKACLVTCATSMLIDYRMDLSTKLGSLHTIYAKGVGICTEMMEVARDLASALSLKTREGISEEHSWPEYFIDGKWYILDPTSGSCIFKESLLK